MKINLNNYILSIKISEQMDLNTLLTFFIQSKKNKYLLFQENRIKVNNQVFKINHNLKINDIVEIDLHSNTIEQIKPEFTTLDICYEDELFLIVNKPPHLLVHSDGVETQHTLSNQVQGYYISNNIPFPVRPIHRLDKDTSGLVLFCKIPFFQPMLDKMLSEKQIYREYDAFVEGKIKQKNQFIELSIARDRHNAKKMRISKNGKYAKTQITCIKKYPTYTFIHVKLYTGRTHQIRVHSQAIQHPLLGDELYGNPSNKISRLALHASTLKFFHPIQQIEVSVHCPLPKDMKKLL